MDARRDDGRDAEAVVVMLRKALLSLGMGPVTLVMMDLGTDMRIDKGIGMIIRDWRREGIVMIDC